jgi:Arc/MetJ family transcription regulator
MRTNIVLDDELMDEALKLSLSKTKKDVIHEALELYVKFKRRKDIRDLKGKIRFADKYNHKTMRTG